MEFHIGVKEVCCQTRRLPLVVSRKAAVIPRLSLRGALSDAGATVLNDNHEFGGGTLDRDGDLSISGAQRMAFVRRLSSTRPTMAGSSIAVPVAPIVRNVIGRSDATVECRARQFRRKFARSIGAGQGSAHCIMASSSLTNPSRRPSCTSMSPIASLRRPFLQPRRSNRVTGFHARPRQ